MKSNLIFIAVLALPLIFIACNKDDEKVELDFELAFPENWESHTYAEEGLVMDAVRKQISETDSFPESVVIFKTSFQSANLALYYQTLKPQIVASDAHDLILWESDTTVNAIDFKKMISQEHLRYIDTYTQDTVVLAAITERYFTYKENYGYNLTFVAVNKTYQEARPVFEDIIGSFQFK